MNRRGFTVIELIIAITLVVVVATVAIPNLIQSRRRLNETTIAKRPEKDGRNELHDLQRVVRKNLARHRHERRELNPYRRRKRDRTWRQAVEQARSARP